MGRIFGQISVASFALILANFLIGYAKPGHFMKRRRTMATYAELASELLLQSTNLARAVGQNNADLRTRMDDFAIACTHVAERLTVNSLETAKKSDA